ncbi:hypothetical protein RHECNPAF_890056 [Rhizobium etli CNPAF512]|nr:hypothetical protein RHECNPAF_890056 [Rhizobium etli CNPAF512]
MIGIVEDVSGRLVDRRYPRAGCRVGLRTGMDRQRVESRIILGHVVLQLLLSGGIIASPGRKLIVIRFNPRAFGGKSVSAGGAQRKQ